MTGPHIQEPSLIDQSSEFSLPLKVAFNSAWAELATNHKPETIRHVNESVFRYFVIKELLKGKHAFEIEDEWNRIDLLLRTKEKQAAIEFKFYDSRPFNSISGTCKYKGGASDKNYGEFVHAINRLRYIHETNWHSIQKANIIEKCLVSRICVNKEVREACQEYDTERV